MQRATTHQTTTQRYYQTFTIAIFPLAIYLFQLLGKYSTVATWIAGVFILLRVILEWRHHQRTRHARPRRSSVAPRPTPVQAPLAGCYHCHQVRPLREAYVGGHRIGVCQLCYQYQHVPFTSRRSSH